MERDKTSFVYHLPVRVLLVNKSETFLGKIIKRSRVFCERPLPAGTGPPPPTPNDNERRR